MTTSFPVDPGGYPDREQEQFVSVNYHYCQFFNIQLITRSAPIFVGCFFAVICCCCVCLLHSDICIVVVFLFSDDLCPQQCHYVSFSSCEMMCHKAIIIIMNSHMTSVW